ncbi:MAG: ATP-grasp domain-containing protein [Rhodobacteraceae bacterium]|nr:ATP-grasp domain-containing protein [Paracoccaceae bacterium]
MKHLRVLVLLDPELMPPPVLKGHSPEDRFTWKTEYDVVSTLKRNGHVVKPLGVQSELKPIRDEIESWRPDVVFNLLEKFHGKTMYDQNVVSYLELLRIPYTGCNPRGLILARGKDLSKKLLAYHRIPVPAFQVVPVGRKIRRSAKLKFPLIVKSLSEDASLGIAQASVVDNDEKLDERIKFVHEWIHTPALVEQFIEGREIYVGILGNDRLKVLPVWELEFGKMPKGALHIATEKVKHDPEYQERRGIMQGPAKNMPPELATRIQRMAKRIYRTLQLDGYARIDFRLTDEGVPYFLEANPNPEIARGEEFAEAALHTGLSYRKLINRLLLLAIDRAGKAHDDEEDVEA